MVLKCLGSSSSGNCYLLEASDGVLIIECGIPALDIKKSSQISIKAGLRLCYLASAQRPFQKSERYSILWHQSSGIA